MGEVNRDGCQDCGRDYGSDNGFPDLIIPNEYWRQISPTGDNGGLLCPSCICKRLADKGFRDIPAAFMSGPIKSVDSELMSCIRWIENLKEQGHGWRCPKCYEFREQSLAGETCAVVALGVAAGA